MPTLLNGTVRNNTVVLREDDLSRYEGFQVVISIVDWKPAKSPEEEYTERLGELFGSGRGNDFEVPGELDFALDAPRVAL